MRILLYGECDQYGSGAWCYLNTLRNKNYNVDFFDRDEGIKMYKTLFYKGLRKLLGGKILEMHRRIHINLFKEKALEFKPDIIIVLKGLLIDAKTINELKEQGAWVVLINHDDFFSTFKGNRSEIQFNAIPEYDYVFCTKEVNVDEIKPFNEKVEMFMFAYFPDIHHPPEKNKDLEAIWASDVAFVGNIYPERVKQLEYLVSHARKSFSLKIYGPNWDKLTRDHILFPYIQKKYIYPDEMRQVIFYSKISLGFLCKENRDDYTQRTFEIPACKGLLLAERTDRHRSFYTEGIEAEFFNSQDYQELVDKVDELLQDDVKRKSIRQNGYNKVVSSRHTYADRLNRLFDLYECRKL